MCNEREYDCQGEIGRIVGGEPKGDGEVEEKGKEVEE